MKITKNTRSNFELYLLAFDKLGGDEFNPFPFEVEMVADGLAAIECFSLLDNQGKASSCRDPDRFAKCQSGKSLLNFWIEQWAEGINDGLFCIDEIKDGKQWVPDWAWVAMRGQLKNPDLGSGEFPWIADLAAAGMR